MRTNTEARQAYLDRAAALLAKDNFTREDSARADRLLALADRVSDPKMQSPAERDFEDWLRSGSRRPPGNRHFTEDRDLNITSPLYGGWLTPASFHDQLMVALRNYDEIFSKDAITFFETHRGTSIVIPFADDTQNQATVIPEASQAEAEVDPIIQPAQQSSIQTSAAPMAGYLPLPPTWRSGMVKVSIEMLQDSAFDIVGFLAEAFAVRFARGIGANIVSTTLAGAKLGVTATGSAANTGGSETGGVSIGWKDLVNMRLAVDAAYRRSPKAAWCMNDNTLGALEGILNKYGTPLFPPSYTASGIRRILGFPVRLCPSMPSIGLSAKSVLFGDLSYLVLRVVKNSVGIRVYKERFADYGQIGFRGFMRAQSALVAESTVQTTFPILYLQNASA